MASDNSTTGNSTTDNSTTISSPLEVAGRTYDEQSFPLFRVIDAIRRAQPSIVSSIEERRIVVADRTGLAGRDLDQALARDLTERSAMHSALASASLALPWSSLIGPWAAFGLVVPGGAFWQMALEVELSYSIAAAYRVEMSPEKLRMASFWLVKLKNLDDLQERALKVGVRVTAKKLIEKLIAIGLSQALAAVSGRAMMATMMRSVPATTPWYVRSIRYLGAPILAVLGWRSTMAVGDRAIAYFSEMADS